jgi:hypothetical protein
VIIRPDGDGLLLITQPDHAALAGRIMHAWQDDELQRSPRRDDILLAVAEHDNGWHEVDAAPVVDAATGTLLDFVGVPYELRTGVWPRAVTRLAETPYAAALVARHALHVYRRYQDDEVWKPFFAQMTVLCDDMLARVADARPDEFHHDYRFVRIGDLASLTFCNGWRETQDEFGCTFTVDGDRLRVSPDPFDGRTVALEVPARRLAQASFDSADAAALAFSRAPRLALRGAATAR